MSSLDTQKVYSTPEYKSDGLWKVKLGKCCDTPSKERSSLIWASTECQMKSITGKRMSGKCSYEQYICVKEADSGEILNRIGILNKNRTEWKSSKDLYGYRVFYYKP